MECHRECIWNLQVLLSSTEILLWDENIAVDNFCLLVPYYFPNCLGGGCSNPVRDTVGLKLTFLLLLLFTLLPPITYFSILYIISSVLSSYEIFF